jgi:hypothetical protein
MRIENEELARKEMKTQVMTYEGERDNTNSSNKLINTTTEYDDVNSVCSKLDEISGNSEKKLSNFFKVATAWVHQAVHQTDNF